jgi:hypothetical protein
MMKASVNIDAGANLAVRDGFFKGQIGKQNWQADDVLEGLQE